MALFTRALRLSARSLAQTPQSRTFVNNEVSSFVCINGVISFVLNNEVSSFVCNNEVSSFVCNNEVSSFVCNNEVSSFVCLSNVCQFFHDPSLIKYAFWRYLSWKIIIKCIRCKIIQKHVVQAIKKWAFNLSGFNQYGLYHDDVLYETDEVKVRNVKEIRHRLNMELYLHTGCQPRPPPLSTKGKSFERGNYPTPPARIGERCR